MRDDELRALGPPTKFDNTLGTTFMDCPRKFYWWKRGFNYTARPSYFAFGSAWGIAQGIWHSSQGPHLDPSDPAFGEAVMAAFGAAKTYFLDAGVSAAPPNDLATLEQLFIRYVDTYQHEPFSIVEGGAEKGWLWPLPSTPYFLGGSIDQYIQWEPFGTLVKEDKTTGIYLNDAYIRQWAFANQVTGYIWYVTNLRGGDCFGCLMNMASKRIPKTTSGKTPQFARQLEKRSEAQLKEFEIDWIYRIHLIEDSYDKWYWPKTMNAINCVGGIGKSPCLYQPLCLSELPFTELDPLQFSGIIEDDTPWEPWDWKDPLKETSAAVAGKTEEAPF